MNNKRKASAAHGAASTGNDSTDRAAKRRKLQEEFGDLSNGETAISTTAYGLNILESIRATTDKSGRPVAPYFESFPSRSEDPEYHKKIRLPLSLELIERKLKNNEYPKLSALESDFKRLVSNAKEINERSSVAFGDAERVRKAVSNLMVKHNPAYKMGNYQAVATPLPPTPSPGAGEEGEEEGDAEDDADGGEDGKDARKGDANVQDVQDTQASEGEGRDGADLTAEEDAEGEEEDAEEEEGGVGGEEDEEEQEDDDDDEGDDDGDDDGDEDEDGETAPATGRRRRPGRPPKNPLAHARKVAARGPTPGKADTHYENVPYEGLNFQQAQEKIVEELLRKKDESDYAYFEPFVYLPPRSLKDYYEIIAEPLSLKALQKQVRGQHGRGGATYVSDFKSWAAFEDQASLIWKNAYHYNEDGSEIFLMAQELERSFHDEVKQAKHHIPEPPQPQPKIKLKKASTSDTPGHPKKITIHVGGAGKTSATGSPAPATGQSGDGDTTRNGSPVGKNPFSGSAAAAVNLSRLEKARSVSTSVGAPSPAATGPTKAEDAVRQSPALPSHHQLAPVAIAPASIVPNGTVAAIAPPPPPPPRQTAAEILEAQKYRPRPIKESEALIPKLIIMSHPSLQLDSRLSITIPASITESQQELIFHAPASHYRLQLRPQIAPFLEAGQREWKLNVLQDSMRLYPSQGPFDKRNEPVFDANLRFGSNRLEVSVVAALPKGERAANGLNMELEKIVVHFNLFKHQ
ncbi:Bromodomain-containing protein [Durotheca rogersii]|uniref:Bromodomain-containing protein n=1 Tax=Durotheca rogersii TaxID=419775 RepID=UPI00221F58AE|nr:Bromodomain-containing protein [Durotheca rogersii]KAI5864805.1 Bromodomain-containing protein [Durotheca rogersii]